MLLKKFSLDRELTAERNKEMSRLMSEVDALIKKEEAEDQRVSSYFPIAELVDQNTTNDPINFEDKVFSLEHIKNICVKFRLRFLPSSIYKGKLPYEAISKVKTFEKVVSEKDILNYYILAPKDFFELKDRYADPLLFAEMSDGKYVLLHKWGSDFKWYSKLINFPFRDLRSVMITSLIFGLIMVALGFYFGFANDSNLFKSLLLKVPMFIATTIFFLTMSIIYGVMSHKDFSDDSWNSVYFN